MYSSSLYLSIQEGLLKEERIQGQTVSDNSKCHRFSEGNQLPEGGGVPIVGRIIGETSLRLCRGRECTDYVGDGIYDDGGVSSDDLTLSLDRDWEGTDTL
jgi:hypothetical protein